MTDFNRYPPSRLPPSSPKAFPRIGKGLVESFYSVHYKQVDFHGQKKDSILIKICGYLHPFASTFTQGVWLGLFQIWILNGFERSNLY